jgi:hypothetical protein
MMSDCDIYASANLMIRRFGEDAKIEAAKRADELLEAGDMDGRAVWVRIIGAIEDLQSTSRPADKQVH